MVRRTRIPSNIIVATNGNGNGAATNGNGNGPSKSVVSEGNMVGRPTVNISERAETRVIQSLQTDPYFSIKVSTKDAATPQLVVLFDGSKGYQFSYNALNGADVVIEGLSAHYQFILNDMVHNASYLDMLKMRVVDPNGSDNCCSGIALNQYARPIKIYDSSKGSESRLLKTIYPDMGVHEGQYQLAINTFQSDIILTNRSAFVYTQEPGIDVVWGFYQVAELGRKQ